MVFARAAPSGGSGAVAASGDIDELACAVIARRYGVGDARRAALGGKYDAVQARVNELLRGTPNAAGTSTGVARIIAGEYKVVANSLSVRSRPNTSGAKVASYGYGGAYLWRGGRRRYGGWLCVGALHGL